MTWTDARVEQLKTLWAEGQSAAAIARELGAITRNAVIGKINRLGLPGRRQTPSGRPASRPPQMAPRPRRRLPLSPSHPRPLVTPKVAAATSPGLGPAPRAPVTIAALTEYTCRWPEGDPRLPGFHFCGRRKASSGPYCEQHEAIARVRPPAVEVRGQPGASEPG